MHTNKHIANLQKVQSIIEKVNQHIKTSGWLNAWNYLDKCGFADLPLTDEEKAVVSEYLSSNHNGVDKK